MTEVAAILPAAGASRRMGSCKQLLPLEGKSVLARAIDTFLAAGVATVIVAVAESAADVAAEAAGSGATAVWVPAGGDMAASVRAALPLLPAGITAVLAHPADHPLVTPPTVRLLARLHREDPLTVLLPVHDGRGGHPTLFPRQLLQRLAPPLTLRDLLADPAYPVRRIPVDDPGVSLDMDTPADYRALQARLRGTRQGR